MFFKLCNKLINPINILRQKFISEFSPPPLQNDRSEIYFWTATINNWRPLLEKDDYEEVIIDSLNWK